MNPNTGKEQVVHYENGKPVGLNPAPAPAPAPATSYPQGNQNVTAPVGTSNQGTTTTASSEVKQQLMNCLGNKAVPEGKEGLYQCLSAAGWKQ